MEQVKIQNILTNEVDKNTTSVVLKQYYILW